MNLHQKHPTEKIPKTFQRKIICYNLLIIICIASAISFYNYYSYRNDSILNATKNSDNSIKILSERLESAYDEMVNIIINCSERKALFFSTLIHNDGSNSQASMGIYAARVLSDYCAVSSYNSYIYKIVLYDKDRLYIAAGNSNGSADDPARIMDASWFEERLTRGTAPYALSLEDSPFPIGRATNPKILPLLRPLKFRHNAAPGDSWVFLGISPKLYEESLSSFSSGQHLYIATQEGELVASLNGESYLTQELLSQMLTGSDTSGSFQTELNQEPCIVTYQKQLASGLLVFEILPLDEIPIDRGVINRTILIIFFFCIGIGLILSFLISRLLSAPIGRLTRRLEIISKGDFEADLSIETHDEIGIIGMHINQMSEHISDLIDTRIQSEKEKKDMEIKMLQAQINPHFLYNTLDSIKWIATMQKNSGIVQVVTALSSLLKNMAKGFNEKVTLRQELDFLENYVTIEKIRYIELFDVDIQIEAEDLYEAKIIKLTLQPLVENAIFSGIEPSGRTGLIQIHAYTKNQTFYVSVTDNGVGITQENILKILTDTSRVTKSHMSGIGLPNVDRRFKLVYGEHYGLTIESELDQYTKITVSLPLEF